MSIADTLDDTVQTWARERPDLDFGGMDTFLRLAAVARAGAALVAADFAGLGVSIAEFDVLATLRRHGDGARLTPTHIAEVAMVKPSGLSHRLARLEKMGLVVRDVDPDDRRSILVTITPAGRDVADRAVEITARRQRELLAGLTESRRRDLHEAADALVRHLSGELVTPR